jgi:hypothetical protein
MDFPVLRNNFPVFSPPNFLFDSLRKLRERRWGGGFKLIDRSNLVGTCTGRLLAASGSWVLFRQALVMSPHNVRVSSFRHGLGERGHIEGKTSSSSTIRQMVSERAACASFSPRVERRMERGRCRQANVGKAGGNATQFARFYRLFSLLR